MPLDFDQEEMRGQFQQRLSQAIMQYGIGAMIDFPERTLTVAAPETWKRGSAKKPPHIIHDTRFERSLSHNGQHIKMFKAPRTLNYVEFPHWHFCPKCHSLQSLDDWKKMMESYGQDIVDKNGRYYAPRCPKCKRQLVPARLVVVCGHGHLDDFPWVEWVHYRNQGGAMPPCEHPHLTYESGNGTETGEDIHIKCSCGATATLKGAFSAGIFSKVNQELGAEIFRCSGYRPERGTHENCDMTMRVFPRGASSVYFSFIRTSLVLPPMGNKVRTIIEDSPTFIKYKDMIANMPNMGMSEDAIKQIIIQNMANWAKDVAEEINLTAEIVEPALREEFLHENTEVDVDDIHYRKEEYDALLANSRDVNGLDKEGTFHKMDEISIREYAKCLPSLDLHLKRVALIDKIGVVRALLGYSRIHPATSRTKEQGFVSIKERETDFYPAFQVFGEGIFIEIDEAAIRNWLNSGRGKKVIQRVEDWKQTLKDGNQNNQYFNTGRIEEITPKFLLLHTLSHLLIRELSFYCGYNVASLSERIYCADNETHGFDMSGIFIYTASGDAEGTLGGLIRQGRADTLPFILHRALAKAKFCSNDPVCINSLGQGLDGQNISACYSCTLLPETSCEEFNVFLDRGVVVGTFDDPDIGFYSDVAATRVHAG